MAPAKKFDPKDHLMKLKGKDYLPVAWRLVWFREAYPAGMIDTEVIELTDARAVIRATVTAVDEDGTVKGRATGTKAQTKQGFADYVEKAETGSIGRALAALGFGTQFDPELDEGDRLADSPVERATTAPNALKAPAPGPNTLDRDKVLRALHATGKDAGFEHIDLHNLIVAKGHESMTTAPVEALVDLGKAIKADPAKLRAWLAKQAELMPSETDVPNPDRFTA